MIKVLKKKNAEYSKSERKVTAIITFFIFVITAVVISNNGHWFSSGHFIAQYLPYCLGLGFGAVTAFLAYKYPKIIHVTLFMLPLMIIGS